MGDDVGAYRYITETFESEYSGRNAVYRNRLTSWRKGPTIERIDKPTNLPRARSLGYKAKRGYAIVRVKVKRGARRRPAPMGGRKAKNLYFIKPSGLSHQVIAEQKAARKYRNMEVLNSYWVGDDGDFSYFEVILADPSIVKISATKRRGRAFRGLTSAGQKGRPSKKVVFNKSIRRKLLLKRLAKMRGRRAEMEKRS